MFRLNEAILKLSQTIPTIGDGLHTIQFAF